MKHPLHMRLARTEDARAIGILVRRVAHRWIVPGQPPDAVGPMLESMSARVIRARIETGQRFHLAFVGDVLAGVAAIRDDSHVFHLFVSTRHQGRGIARKLWDRMLRDSHRRAGTRLFTLNAAPGAVPVYLRLGCKHNPKAKPVPGKLLTVPMVYRMTSPVRRTGRAR